MPEDTFIPLAEELIFNFFPLFTSLKDTDMTEARGTEQILLCEDLANRLVGQCTNISPELIMCCRDRWKQKSLKEKYPVSLSWGFLVIRWRIFIAI